MARPRDVPQLKSQPHSVRSPRQLLEEAELLRQQGKLDRAESACYSLVRRHPGYVAALHTLGLVYLDKGNFERALDCLVRASMRDPTNWMTLTALSLAYLRLGASEMASQTLHKALEIRPQDASIFSSLGEIYREEREYELAENAYRQALTFEPTMETPVAGLALCLSNLGRTAEAAKVLGEAYGRGVRSLRLLHVMTTLPRGAIPVDILKALDPFAIDLNASSAALKNTFLFVKAAAFDAAENHKEAWDTLVAANRPLAKEHYAQLKADIAARGKSLARLRAVAGAARPLVSGDRPVSLFILGPSRSGKTTLERLVGSLDQVKIGCEAPVVEKAVNRSFQTAALPTGSHLDDLPEELLSLFRQTYLEDVARRAGSARVFTNTRPGHIHYAARLASVIPNARFLLVKRDADDVAWRIYLTKYLSGNPYAYDLDTIIDYLNWYNEMIDLTAKKLPEITRIVRYEAIVDDPAASLHDVAELCGLDFNREPLPPIPNDRGCATPYRAVLNPHG